METLKLWDDKIFDLELNDIKTSMSNVKGEMYKNPLKFLEIYIDDKAKNNNEINQLIRSIDSNTVKIQFLKSFNVLIGQNIKQPPYIWKDIHPSLVITNFLYNSNAFFRILKNLEKEGSISINKIDTLLDDGCRMLSSIYKYNNYFVIKHINNNINMSLITKIIELMLGKSAFNIVKQESKLTQNSLKDTLKNIDEYCNYSVSQIMGMAIARGRVFYDDIQAIVKESGSERDRLSQTFKYYSNELKIDFRNHLINRIRNSNENRNYISMSVILDDTSESVLDLLWIQKLLLENKFFKINLILNTAQVSVNFSSNMLAIVLSNPSFNGLASRIGISVMYYETLFPLISFQPNLFNNDLLSIITKSDVVYVKGMNFFETFQLKNSDVYHAFVVGSKVSEALTGLNTGDAVFAFVPAEKVGFNYQTDINESINLLDITKSIKTY